MRVPVDPLVSKTLIMKHIKPVAAANLNGLKMQHVQEFLLANSIKRNAADTEITLSIFK